MVPVFHGIRIPEVQNLCELGQFIRCDIVLPVVITEHSELQPQLYIKILPVMSLDLIEPGRIGFTVGVP